VKRLAAAFSLVLWALAPGRAQELPANRWVELRKDPAGARPGSAVRYADGQFFLWGFMNHDPDLLQEIPLMEAPEYDMVAFDLGSRSWRGHMPKQMEEAWSRHLPLAFVPRTYAGITTGSERTVMRGPSNEQEAVPRPDLNVVFDQVTYRPANHSLYYFTGGLTAAYDIASRRWTDLRPRRSPPPVLGGSLAYDPVHDEILLFGGGHVAEQGPGGSIRGYTGTWVYRIRENDWQELPLQLQPPPRMNTRLVCDTRNQVLVLFGGDGQRSYLADTWIFDLKTRAWRASKAPGGPEPRAGHFTVYDPGTGYVLIGGGYNRKDLADMWAYDAGADRWLRAEGEVPSGFQLTADITPDERTIVLVTSSRAPDDRMTCNIIFPVRTTYGFRIVNESLIRAGEAAEPHAPMPKRLSEATASGTPAAEAALARIPVNRWVALESPGRTAPLRTWGSATFDTKRERILYWGGGHCGYEGSDVDLFDVATNTWIPETPPASYPERLWNHGVRPAGVTFDGEPWTDHGRRIYAYDPVGDRLVMVRPIRLTSGYDPAWLRAYPSKTEAAADALVHEPSSYTRYATWSYDLAKRRWSVIGPAPAGLDTLVSTPLGVMGVNVFWPGRLNDAGYNLPWTPSDPPVDNAIFLLRGGRWERLSGRGPSPQNLYELTSLAYDTKRGQVILHGAGANRNELWTFDVKTRAWENRRPRVPEGSQAPECAREAVYIPDQDVFLTIGGGTWVYDPVENAWRKPGIGEPGERSGQNRAMIYDAKRGLVFLVLGEGGDDGRASVYALRFRRADPLVRSRPPGRLSQEASARESRRRLRASSAGSSRNTCATE
jgi:hypothetical protein